MSQPLSWNLNGNDQLTQILDRLATTVDKLTRRMETSREAAQNYSRGLTGAGAAADRMGDQVAGAGRQSESASGRLGAAGRNAESAGGSFGRLGSMAATAARTVASVGIAAVAGFGMAAGAAAGFGIKTAAANETASISFEVLLGSVEKAQQFMGRLKEFAAATPFDLPTLREAASGFLTVGINADRIIPLLTRLGDATAAMGTGSGGIDRATYALKQMALAGKATKEDLNQLTDAGIPILDALAAHMKMSVADVLEAVSDGKVSAENVYQAIEQGAGSSMQRISGMMSRQSATLEGIWSTFKDNASQSLATFVEPAIPAVKGVVDWLGVNVPVALDYLTQLGTRFKTIFEGDPVPGEVMDSLKTMALDLVPKLKDNLDKLLKTVEDNKEGLDKFGRLMSEVVIPALGASVGWTIQVVAVLGQIGIVLMAVAVPALRWFTAVFLTNLGIILDTAVITFGWIPGLGPKLREAQGWFHQFADGVMAKLNELDGRSVGITVTTTYRSYGQPPITYGATPTVSWGGGRQEFAEGGMVLGPEGSPQAAIVHAGERVLTRQQQAEMARGSNGDGDEMLAPVNLTLEGFSVWQGLLKFKRRTSRTSLGLA